MPDALGVRRSAVGLVSGATSGTEVVEVDGRTDHVLRVQLAR